MPHLRFRGFDEDTLERQVPALTARLAAIFGCPGDWITVESVATRFLTRPAQPMVEIVWFDRSPAVRDAVAAALHETAPGEGLPAPVVIFTPVAPNNYYENGKNFSG